MVVYKPNWFKYGLSVANWDYTQQVEEHDLVANYLDAHPECKYWNVSYRGTRPDDSWLYSRDVLKLAEQEHGY